GRWTGRRSRRLPAEAFRTRRASGPYPGAAAPCRAHHGGGGRGAADPSRRPQHRPGGAARLASRTRSGTVQKRGRPAGAAGPQCGERAGPLHDLRPDLGVCLRSRIEESGGLHQLSAPQTGAGRHHTADPDGPRRRLHPQAEVMGAAAALGEKVRGWVRGLGGASLGTRFAVTFAAVAAAVIVLMGSLAYSAAATLIRNSAEQEFNATVSNVAQTLRNSSTGNSRF